MKRITALLCLSLAYSAHGQITNTLPSGRAPALQTSHWLKGDSVSGFTPGSNYVVYFTHTACAPCRLAVPHLSRLAEQYGNIHLIAIYSYFKKDTIAESDYLKVVKQLIRTSGAQMNFSIAMDKRQRQSLLAFFGEAEPRGFPAIFLVDTAGEIIWRGISVADLSHVITQLSPGNFDAAKEKREAAAIKKGLVRSNTMISRGDTLNGLRILDSLAHRHPERKEEFRFLKFSHLAQAYPDEANVIFSELLAGNPMFVHGMDIFGFHHATRLDPQLGLKLAERILTMNSDPFIQSDVLVNVAFLMAKNQYPKLAMVYLREAIHIYRQRLNAPANDPILILYRDYEQLFRFLTMAQQNLPEANQWLFRQINESALSFRSANNIRFRADDLLNTEVKTALDKYSKQIRQMEQASD